MSASRTTFRDNVAAGLLVTVLSSVLGSLGGLILVYYNSGGIVKSLGGVTRADFDALQARVTAITTKRGSEGDIPIRAPIRGNNVTYGQCPDGAYISKVQTVFNDALMGPNIGAGVSEIVITCTHLGTP